MDQQVPVATIMAMNERYRSGVLRHRPVDHCKPNDELGDIDIRAIFRFSPQVGIDPDEAATVAGEKSKAMCSVRMSYPVNHSAFQPGLKLVRQEGARRALTDMPRNHAMSRAPQPTARS